MFCSVTERSITHCAQGPGKLRGDCPNLPNTGTNQKSLGIGGIASPQRLTRMLDNFWWNAAAVIGVLHVAGPVALHSTFRYARKITLSRLSTKELPKEVAKRMEPRIAEMESLRFALVGCYDCGELTLQTRTYVAYFCNRTTNDFANVTAVVTPRGVGSYFEFSTRFSSGMVLETNTNKTLPLTPGNPGVRVFRFADVAVPETLYAMHRQLLEKYAAGMWPAEEPKGQEIQRLVRVLENYGPRHEKIGYMALAEDGESYRLTWKGAFLMAWRGLWPASLLRRMTERHAMKVERHELEVSGVAALQKA